MLHRHPVYQKRMLHRHRVYVPSAGAGGCAKTSLAGTTAAWEEEVEKNNVKCCPELKIECETHRICIGKESHMSTHTVSRLRCSTPTCPECSTAILYTSRECSTTNLYTLRECSTAIVYAYPVLALGDALKEVWLALQLHGKSK